VKGGSEDKMRKWRKEGVKGEISIPETGFCTFVGLGLEFID
jgi:hypothetical protein